MQGKDHKISHITNEPIFAIPAMKPFKVLIVMIFCVVLISLDINYRWSDFIRGYAKDALEPITFVQEIPSILVTYYKNLFSSREKLLMELKRVKTENEKLTLITSRIDEITKRNKELGSLWEGVHQEKKLYALVKKRSISSNPLRPFMTINIVDINNKIKVNQAVLSNLGIVGKIKSKGFYNAEVILAHNLESNIPVISSLSRLHGIVKGGGFNRPGRLINIKKTALFSEGEKLISSGLGGVFPEGYLVAEIESIKDEPDNDFLDIKVSFLEVPQNIDNFLVYLGRD
tara:strand:- start:2 stop:862 length:861 start_codon:yes stop_codon:yes gene_type:complete